MASVPPEIAPTSGQGLGSTRCHGCFGAAWAPWVFNAVKQAGGKVAKIAGTQLCLAFNQQHGGKRFVPELAAYRLDRLLALDMVPVTVPREAETKTLSVPNRSRSFDAAKSRVRFWGYDSAIEISFFLETGALRKLIPETDEAEAAFNRAA